jgi:hypothetical protein
MEASLFCFSENISVFVSPIYIAILRSIKQNNKFLFSAIYFPAMHSQGSEDKRAYLSGRMIQAVASINK